MMNKLQKIKLCDWILLFVMAAMLASSIQLEIIAAGVPAWVWVHIVLGVSFFGLIAWHVQLHFQWRNWAKMLWRQKSAPIKWLAAIGLLTLITAIVATVGWVRIPEHSVIGGVHGKLGFLMIFFAIGHAVHRRKFYGRKV